jgi:hypothetical protein
LADFYHKKASNCQSSESSAAVERAERGKSTCTSEWKTYELDADHIIWVGPTARRKILPGPDGVRLLAIGGFLGRA